jgi:DNA-binding XRE family transcriptional regulator
MWSTVVPTWNTVKHPSRIGYDRFTYLTTYLRSLWWNYSPLMASNTRERTPWSDAVANEVRAERARKGWTQLEMVRHTGLSRSTYMRIESGEHIADASELARICGAVGIPLSEFFRRVEERNPEASAELVDDVALD